MTNDQFVVPDGEPSEADMQIAVEALKSSSAFCALMSGARDFRISGWWEGFGFCSHPHGVIVGTIKMTNYHHVDDVCSIEITSGSGWDVNVCTDSVSYGDPHPKPIDGRGYLVWRNGDWANSDFETALSEIILEILASASYRVRVKSEHAEIIKKEKLAREKAEEKADIAIALAKAVGGTK